MLECLLDLDVTEAVSDMVKTDQNDGNILPLFQNWAAALDIKSSQSPAAVMNNYHGRALCMATVNGGNITLISFLKKNCANSPCMSVIRLAVLPPSSCLCPPQQEHTRTYEIFFLT